MRRVDGVVGNVDEPELADAVAAHERRGSLETVVLDDTDRKRSRLRVSTESGTDLGVLVDRPELTAGDVLVLEDELAVVVAFERREAFVVDLPSDVAASTAVELGHRIGNQHWDIAIDDGTLYVPVEADRAIIEDVLGPYLPAAATTRYETVDAERFVDGDGTPADDEHSHGTDNDHSHSHGDDHSHAHE